MKIKSRESCIPAGLFGRRILPGLFLAALCALVTGCPHNDYLVELKPAAHGMERTLTFYREDDSDSNGVPNYVDFPSNELASITQTYPAGAIKTDGQRRIAKGEFAGAMPGDVGGAGGYTNYATSLGESGVYMERFRGNDDVAGKILKQYRAADQLADLVIGWSKTQFEQEKGYKKLRLFLDGDFRNDLKNAGQYFKLGTVNNLVNTNAVEEYTARFFQYLIERKYLKLSDVAGILRMPGGNESGPAVLLLMQRLAAEKMEIAADGPLPKSLCILTNEIALQKSWEDYLAQGDGFRSRHKEWANKVKMTPNLPEPKPTDEAGTLCMDLLGVTGGFDGAADHLVVKLALKQAPDHSNGEWKDGKIVWKADMSDDQPLPVLCYASWNNPDEVFQKAHLGGVMLTGDGLSTYNLWRSGLGTSDGQAWDAFVAGLQPDAELKGKLEAFQLDKGRESPLYGGAKLLIEALGKNGVK